MNTETLGVAVIEDDAATRSGLAWLIDAGAGFRCVGAFGSVAEALRGDGPAPEVVLLDIHLPGILGSQAVPLLRDRWPRAQVVMLTVYAEEDRILESLCNGACGYLLKKAAPDELLGAIRSAHEGGSPMSSEIATKVVGLLRKTGPAGRPEAALTPQETRLLALLAEGHSYESAGANLDITVNTVRNHVRSIYDKLQVHSRSEAVSKALRGGLIR